MGPSDPVLGSDPSPAASSAETALSSHSVRAARSGRVARAVSAALTICLALLAVLFAAASLASYGWVKARLDAFASDGEADVTRADFDAIVVRLRLAAAALALAAVAAHLGRRRIQETIAELVRSTAEAASSLRRAVAGAVAAGSRLHLAALSLITVAALLVRLDFLFQPMRYDESVSYIHFSSQPWYIAVTHYDAPNNHVFHSLLVHISTQLFGGAPWAIRLPAFVAGILVVPAAYVAARALYGKHAAIVAAALVTTSSMIIEYSTNARGYTLTTLLFLVLLTLATHLWHSSSHAEWLAFAVVAAIGFWTIPVMLYGFGGIVVWLVLLMARRRQLSLLRARLVPYVVVTGVLTGLLYLPVVVTSGAHSLVANDFVAPTTWSYFTDHIGHSLVSTFERWNRDIPLPLAAVIGAGFLVALVTHRRVSRFDIPPAVAAVFWVAPLLVLQRVVPFERVWLFLLPVYLMTAAAGLVLVLRPVVDRVGRDGLAAVLVALGLAGALGGEAVASRSVYRSDDTSTFRDSAPVAAFLAARLRPDDKVLVAPPADAILEYQLDRRDLDPASLLYWPRPGSTKRFFVVVKLGPRDYPLSHLLADPRVRAIRLGQPDVLRRFSGSVVYEVRRRTGG